MLEAVAGYYNGESIILSEKVCWDNGQEVIVALVPKSKFESNIDAMPEEKWKAFLTCINGFSDDFMDGEREK